MENKKHTHGFKMPEGYLDNLEERLLSKIKEESLPKETGFSVPEGYFESVDEKVMQQIAAEKNDPKVISLLSRKALFYVAGVAACAVLIVSIVTSAPNEGEAVTQEDVSNYIDDDNLDFDAYDIASLFQEEDLSNVFLEDNLFSEENLEDYLLENLDDTEFLIE